MKKIFKTTLKVFVSLLVLIIAALIIIPVFFEEDIMNYAKKTINEKVNADVDFKSLDISLIKNFPNLAIEIQDIKVINRAPFEGDTLFYSQSIQLKLSLNTLFKKKEDPYEIKHISISNADANVRVLESGKANYDIAISTDDASVPKQTAAAIETSTTDETASTSAPLKLSLKEYQLNNINIHYLDETMKFKTDIIGLKHHGSGDFTTSQFDLQTETEMNISLDFDGVNYLNNNFIGLYAAFGIDLDTNTYKFLKNKFVLNKLELNFDGFIKLLDEGQQFDLSFNTPSTSFLSFLEMIPAKYTKSLDGIKTDGQFMMNGVAKGILDDKKIPTFKIDMVAKDAMFQYPDLPKSVTNIQLETHITNDTGITNDTKIDLKNLSFAIDKDFFSINSYISNVIDNPNIKAQFNGNMDLSNISKAYPIDMEVPLEGLLKTNVKTTFDMNSIDKKEYEKVALDGHINISKLNYKNEMLPHPVDISELELLFSTKDVRLTKFSGKSGKSDFDLNGRVDNLIGFIFKDETIVAKLDMKSKMLDVSDFMPVEDTGGITTEEDNTVAENTDDNEAENTPATPAKEEASERIPAYIDFTFDTAINNIIYDDITLKNTKGKVIIRDQKLILNHLDFDIFKGHIKMDANIDTKPEIMPYHSKIKIDKLDINQSFTTLKTLGKIAPIANSMDGFFNSDINLKGILNNDYTPDTDKLTGKMSLSFTDAKFTPEKSKILTKISDNVNFINLKKVNLNDVKIFLTVKDSKVTVEPFDFKQDDVVGTISGTHGFDQSIDYNVKTMIPMKYLGDEIGNTLKQLNSPSLMKTKIPLSVGIRGNFTKPQIALNMKKAVKDAKETLKKEGMKQVKAKAKEVGKKAVKEGGKILKDMLEGKKSDKPIEDQIKDKASDLLKGLF